MFPPTAIDSSCCLLTACTNELLRFFGEIERDFSSSIMSNTARTFDTYVARGVMLNNYANIFGLIMQMRQVANHPDLLLKKHAAEGQNVF